MENKLKVYAGSFLMLIFCLFMANVSYGQEKETQEKQGLLEVSKSYTINSGAVTIEAKSENVHYATFEQNPRTLKWEVLQDFKEIENTNEPVEICAREEQKIKVEVRMECEKCATVSLSPDARCD